MFIELADSLRCVNEHEQTWLVLAMDEVDGRDVIRGTLGCPVCRAEYAIVDGAVRFGDKPVDGRPLQDPSEERATRIAAFLALTEPRGFAVLSGASAVDAPLVASIAPTHLVLLDPVSDVGASPSWTVIYGGGRVPIAAQSARGVALGGGESPDTIAGLAESVAAGGRMIGALGQMIPSSLTELARDERTWVATREAVSRPIALRRG